MTAPVVRPRREIAAWIVAPIAIVLGLLVLLLATRNPNRAESSPLVGNLAPAIVGDTLDDGTYDLDELRGEWVVVNFFSTTCVPCIVEHPELVAFDEAHDAGDASVVSIAFDDSTSNVADFFEENGGDWPVVVSNVGNMAVSFGVTGVPESYLVAPSGVVAAKFIGGITKSDMEDTIAALEAGPENDSQ